jgi:hypothetical protein
MTDRNLPLADLGRPSPPTGPPGAAPPRRRPRLRRSGPRSAALAAAAALPALLALALYGWHLGDGLLADDFLYAAWARTGIRELLGHTTIASHPQMIRPLPALVWMLVLVPSGAVLLHAVSVALHAANGLLLAAIVHHRANGSAGVLGWRPLACGALFVAFPLFGEPVIWLSASFDLWACGFALAAILAAGAGSGGAACRVPAAGDGDEGAAAGSRAPDRGATGGAVAATAGLFLAGLLCKESIVCLPAVLPALYGWRRTRRTVVATAAVAAAYIGLRLVLFAGPGGYLDEQGHANLWPPHPAQQLGLLALRLVLRLLVPLKPAGLPAFAPPLAATASLVLLGGCALAALAACRTQHEEPSHAAADTPADAAPSISDPGHRALVPPPIRGRARADLARAALAVTFAMLPVLALAMIDSDLQGSRLLYFPVAVAAVAAGLLAPAPLRPLGVGGVAPPARRAAILLAAALLAYWSLAALWNNRAWTRAAWEVEHTLTAMAAVEPGLPSRALVYVAGHDSWHGAFTWRNGIAAAARWRGLRPDLRWYLGTVAGIDRPGDGLGRDLFEIGIDERGHAVDLTACEAALLAQPAALLATWTLPESPNPDRDAVSPPTRLSVPAAGIQVRLVLADRRPPQPVSGQLYWLTSAAGHFNTTDSAPFFLGPRAAAEVVLRVPAAPAPVPRPFSMLRLWIQLPAAARAYVRHVRVAVLPAACYPSRYLHQLR